MKQDKNQRVLHIYTKLLQGKLVNKEEEAVNFGVDARSVQRDIEDVRTYLEEQGEHLGCMQSVVYDRQRKGYRLEQVHTQKFTNGEVLALCKILLDSRAFPKEKMLKMLEKVVVSCVEKPNQNAVSDLIRNEAFHYVEPRHQTDFLDTMWDIGQAIRNRQYIEIDYLRTKDKAVVKRKLQPVAILFSEYYFYMTAFLADKEVRKGFSVLEDAFPTIYRIDRIKGLSVLSETFHIPYKDRFEEGEFRKRVQFMYGGKLQKVKFRYVGSDVDAVLDRLPTAKIVGEESGAFVISAEVFGSGIEMWLNSQGAMIERIEGE